MVLEGDDKLKIFNFFRKKRTQDIKVKQEKTRLVNMDINPIYKKTMNNMLFPGEIILLDWLNGKSEKDVPPKYFKYTYGIHFHNSRKMLLNNNYLIYASLTESLSSLTIPLLKNILKENELKLSGNKPELISRIQSNLSNEQLEKYIKNKTFKLSKLGIDILKKYYYIVPAHKHGSNDNVYNVASAIRYVKNFNGDYNPPNGDIAWGLFQESLLENRQKGHYGLIRNTILSMGEQLNREEKLKHSLMQYLQVLILDMSGLSNNNRLEHPDFLFIAPGIVSRINQLKIKISIDNIEFQKLLNKAWEQVSVGIPYHYLSKEECLEALKDILNNGSDIEVSEKHIKRIANNKFNQLDEKYFSEKYHLQFPIIIK